MPKVTKHDLLAIARAKGWDAMFDDVVLGSDPCESYRNAVKAACRKCDPLHPDTACDDALDALAECMTKKY
jgi:hypothetical protein